MHHKLRSRMKTWLCDASYRPQDTLTHTKKWASLVMKPSRRTNHARITLRRTVNCRASLPYSRQPSNQRVPLR
ncbi:hypothetical protein PSEUDO8Z_140138 [Pseudomonas sp. 8Z]|nr:hypothetical protein PSEUDO8Z_140138 [Pseudomonas sp. 8Z]